MWSSLPACFVLFHVKVKGDTFNEYDPAYVAVLGWGTIDKRHGSNQRLHLLWNEFSSLMVNIYLAYFSMLYFQVVLNEYSYFWPHNAVLFRLGIISIDCEFVFQIIRNLTFLFEV